MYTIKDISGTVIYRGADVPEARSAIIDSVTELVKTHVESGVGIFEVHEVAEDAMEAISNPFGAPLRKRNELGLSLTEDFGPRFPDDDTIVDELTGTVWNFDRVRGVYVSTVKQIRAPEDFTNWAPAEDV